MLLGPHSDGTALTNILIMLLKTLQYNIGFRGSTTFIPLMLTDCCVQPFCITADTPMIVSPRHRLNNTLSVNNRD